MSGIKEDVEKKIYELLGEVGDRIGAERVQQIIETAFTGAVRTKKAVDKNVESLLSIANIPSRREYDRMRIKLDALQGSVVSLSRTVEELRDRFARANGASQARPPNSAAAAAAKGARSSAATKSAAHKIAAARAKTAHAQAPKRAKSSRTKRAR